jgi:hypothetical protein
VQGDTDGLTGIERDIILSFKPPMVKVGVNCCGNKGNEATSYASLNLRQG